MRPPSPCCCRCTLHPTKPHHLYRYDDLTNYTNERSLWLAKLRDTIEEPWQEWELGQLLASPDVAEGVSQGSIEGYRGLSVESLQDTFRSR